MTKFVIIFNIVLLVYCVGLLVFAFIKRRINKKKCLKELEEENKDNETSID